MIIVNTATEDELSEAVAIRMIEGFMRNGKIGHKIRQNGSGYLKANIRKICALANREHTLLLTDLDRQACSPELIGSWLGPNGGPDKLILRVAEREIEAWLLADKVGLAHLLGLSAASLPDQPDELSDPKKALLQAARRAKKSVRTDMVKLKNSEVSQGLGYNRLLSNFVGEEWNVDEASERSPSLKRAITRLRALGRE